LNKQEQTGEVDPPDDEPTSTVVRPLIIIPLAPVGTAVIVAFVLLIVKKKDCPCKKKQSQ
jgi:hypothetical protein